MEEVRKVESSLRDELEKKHDAELRSLRADYTNESDNLKAQIDVLRTAKLSSESALQVAITNQAKAFDEKFATISDEKINIIQEYEGRLRDMENQHRLGSESLQDELTKKMVLKEKESVNMLQTRHAEELKKCADEFLAKEEVLNKIKCL